MPHDSVQISDRDQDALGATTDSRTCRGPCAPAVYHALRKGQPGQDRSSSHIKSLSFSRTAAVEPGCGRTSGGAELVGGAAAPLHPLRVVQDGVGFGYASAL